MPESLIILICENNHKSRFSSQEGLALLPVVRVQFCSALGLGEIFLQKETDVVLHRLNIKAVHQKVNILHLQTALRGSSQMSKHTWLGSIHFCRCFEGWGFTKHHCCSSSGCRHSEFAMSRTRGKCLCTTGKQSCYMSLKVFRTLP